MVRPVTVPGAGRSVGTQLSPRSYLWVSRCVPGKQDPLSEGRVLRRTTGHRSRAGVRAGPRDCASRRDVPEEARPRAEPSLSGVVPCPGTRRQSPRSSGLAVPTHSSSWTVGGTQDSGTVSSRLGRFSPPSGRRPVRTPVAPPAPPGTTGIPSTTRDLRAPGKKRGYRSWGSSSPPGVGHEPGRGGRLPVTRHPEPKSRHFTRCLPRVSGESVPNVG